MSGDEGKQFCQLLARLVDAVESVAREAGSPELDLIRLHNIRHDTLVMLARMG